MYHLVYGFVYIVSLLPLKVLYLLSDLLYLVIYYLAGYRKDVVRKNLAMAFPEKSTEERRAIEKKFYRNFADTFVETIKLFSAGDKFILDHVEAEFGIFDRYFAEGKKVQVHMGHNFNWEFFNAFGSIKARQAFIGVYMPLDNKTADKLFKKMRSRFGTVLVPANKLKSSLLPYRSKPYLLGLIADQTPPNALNAYWVDFFGRPTAFLKGPEKGARAGNLPVVYSYSSKIKRGHYKVHIFVLEEHPENLDEGKLTAAYAMHLEKSIRQYPEMWLWSHRRWKHEWKAEYGKVQL